MSANNSLVLRAVFGPRPEPPPNTTLVIACAGASFSGKSTFTKFIAERCHGSVISFADPLRESARRAGWTGEKTPEMRAFIQQHSQQEKEKHGESLYADAVISRITERVNPHNILLIDDLRHFVELNALMTMESKTAGMFSVLPLHFHNPFAELRWLEAAMSPVTDDTKWAHHRSETEWRSYRSFLPQFDNIAVSADASESEKQMSLSKSLLAFNSFLRRVSVTYYNIEYFATLPSTSNSSYPHPSKDQ
jgi:adenosyl cobinamide kinase/adenosyl cobinamide phosphate guanylyltransferase